MTIHYYRDYKCRKCGLPYIPLPNASKCPYCGYPADQVFEDFMDSSLESVSYNINSWGIILPAAWGVFTAGDNYYLAGFYLLHSLYFKYLSENPGPQYLLHYRISLKELFEKISTKEECITKAKDMIMKSLSKVEDDKEKALLKHINIFLMRICDKFSEEK